MALGVLRMPIYYTYALWWVTLPANIANIILFVARLLCLYKLDITSIKRLHYLQLHRTHSHCGIVTTLLDPISYNPCSIISRKYASTVAW